MTSAGREVGPRVIHFPTFGGDDGDEAMIMMGGVGYIWHLALGRVRLGVCCLAYFRHGFCFCLFPGMEILYLVTGQRFSFVISGIHSHSIVMFFFGRVEVVCKRLVITRDHFNHPC